MGHLNSSRDLETNEVRFPTCDSGLYRRNNRCSRGELKRQQREPTAEGILLALKRGRFDGATERS